MNSLGMALQLALCNLSKDSHFCVLHFYKLRVFLGKVRGLATAAWLTGRRMPSRSRSQFIDSWPGKTKYAAIPVFEYKQNKQAWSKYKHAFASIKTISNQPT